MSDRPVLRPLAAAIALFAGQTGAEEVEFNTAFMSPGSQQKIDISRYERGLAVPGVYRVRILVNGVSRGVHDVTVQHDGPVRHATQLCLAARTLNQLELDVDKLEPAAGERLRHSEPDTCLPLKEIIPQATLAFEAGEQLDIDIPGLYLQHNPRGYVNPERWDRGITAGMLSYNANYYGSQNHASNMDSAYLGLNSGFNLAGWYLRHNGSWSWSNSTGSSYQTLDTYLQRDIPAIEGRLTLGDTSTSGELFDTLAFRGLQLANETLMRPNSQRGYAPLIRGNARTNARVQVMQQDRLLYETTVPPGDFEINDLYPTGYGGELEVVILEADGTTQRQTIPFAPTSNLLRPGMSNYSATLGKLRKGWIGNEPLLGEVTWQRGLNNFLTGYLGLQGNKDYQAAQLGSALGTPVGAFSLDVTHAKASLAEEMSGRKEMSGQSYQLKYSQHIQRTNSHVSLAAYRFSTASYLDYVTTMQIREQQSRGDNSDLIQRPKSRLGITATQILAEGWGSFYLNAYQQNYWNTGTRDRQYQLGYNNRLGKWSYSISASRTRNGSNDFENRYMLNVSIPLGSEGPFRQMSVNMSREPKGVMREQVNMSGSALADSALSYSLSGSGSNKGGSPGVSASSALRTVNSTLQASAGSGKNYHNYSLGMSGAVIAHGGGLTLTPYSGDTQALVEAKGASGAAVSGYPGVRIDDAGYAIVPYLNAYQINEISIDPKGLSQDIALDDTSQKVVPYNGAVVKLRFNTTQGRAVMIQLQGNDALPFGADVLDEQQNVVGVVGQGKRAFARLENDAGKLTVRWGGAEDERCRITYRLPAKGPDMTVMTALCR
ncbi:MULTISPECIES: fimbria/pilus outer membrane usher protein [Raoultella]|uniref:fimbria/pilus outer membrane usher protein n=1 Tax=Raoultella TaxID=160674 RepID=UPI00216850F0|nr:MULTISPECIES: fimbria/pilus outer membrane usher protein [Raoultella]MCS4270052.1 outer membrane usher protein [Raoultella sp. BIGb0132]MCS4287012.1 outer membrane usher protein [Raoultella terrigena]